jgi:hypothetical protein
VERTISLVVFSDGATDEFGLTTAMLAPVLANVPYQVILAANGTPIDPDFFAQLPFAATAVTSATRVPPGVLLNGALAQAKGDVVTFLPAGMQPEPWWTAGVFELLERPEVGAVAPRIVDPSGDRIVATGIVSVNGGLHLKDAGAGRDQFSPLLPASMFCSFLAGLSIRRAVIEQVGLFDVLFETSLYDLDWTLRARAQNLAVAYRPDVTMRYGRPIPFGPGLHSAADVARFRERWQNTFGAAIELERLA